MHAYNTTLPPIRLRAYGRHIQAMAEVLCETSDRELRNQQAVALVQLMRFVAKKKNGQLESDIQAWTDLLAISPDLDIDLPFALPAQENDTPPEKRLSYSQQARYNKCCGAYLTQLAQQVGKEITKTKTPAQEALLEELVKCALIVHKDVRRIDVLQHMSQVVGHEITLTPTLEKMEGEHFP